MQPNLGAFSRISRTLLGIAFLALLWLAETPWGLLGVPLIASAAAGWCPLCTATDRPRGE